MYADKMMYVIFTWRTNCGCAQKNAFIRRRGRFLGCDVKHDVDRSEAFDIGPINIEIKHFSPGALEEESRGLNFGRHGDGYETEI